MSCRKRSSCKRGDYNLTFLPITFFCSLLHPASLHQDPLLPSIKPPHPIHLDNLPHFIRMKSKNSPINPYKSPQIRDESATKYVPGIKLYVLGLGKFCVIYAKSPKPVVKYCKNLCPFSAILLVKNMPKSVSEI